MYFVRSQQTLFLKYKLLVNMKMSLYIILDRHGTEKYLHCQSTFLITLSRNSCMCIIVGFIQVLFLCCEELDKNRITNQYTVSNRMSYVIYNYQLFGVTTEVFRSRK
jgi:hypothetical protein